MALSIGKWRGLQQTATPQGTFSVLALDHRGNLRRAFNPDAPGSVSDALLIELKLDIAAALATSCSAILIDPQTGGAQCVTNGTIPGSTGMIVTLDATGYTGDPHARTSRLIEGWSAGKARRMGASAVKLLVYYHPGAPNAAAQEQLVRDVAGACRRLDIAFFLEPLSFSFDPDRRKLPSDERREVVIETARRLVPLGADILKAEFPVDVEEEKGERAWVDACKELTAACPVPWLLLSAGVDFETYLRQVRVACEAGASGIMAGRAVWKEAVQLKDGARRRFLNDVAYRRMARLGALCDALARPFYEVHEVPVVSLDWYVDYESL